MRRCAVTLVLPAASVVQLSEQTNAAAMATRRWRQQRESAAAELWDGIETMAMLLQM
jgi:hypothetical protein